MFKKLLFGIGIIFSGLVSATQFGGANFDEIFKNDVSVVGAIKITSGSYITSLQGSASATASKTYTLPITDGTGGKVLTTDGSGVLSWGTGGVIASTSGVTSSPTAGATFETFLGSGAGDNGGSKNYTTFIGLGAGYGASSSDNSQFIGRNAGRNACSLGSCEYIGNNTGDGATDASFSVFIGDSAGTDAENAARSIFIGDGAGYDDTVDNTASGGSILIGNSTSTKGFENSIAIGTGAENTAENEIVIGGDGASASKPLVSKIRINNVPWVHPGANASGVLTNDGSGTLSWEAAVVPAGNNTEIQFNDSSAFGADSSFIWDNGAKTLGVYNTISDGLAIDASASGATAGSTAIRGVASHATTANIGIEGESASTSGTAIKGMASASSGTNYAIYASTSSTSGFSGYFLGGKNYFEKNVGFGTDTPDAYIKIKAGTSTAGTAPLKFTSSGAGVGLATKEAGAVEFEGSLFYTSGDLVRMGVGGDIHVVPGDVQPAGITTERDLTSFTLPANAFDDDGDHIQLETSYTCPSNANTKTFKIYFGGTVIFDSSNGTYGGTSQTGQKAIITAKVYRRGATSFMAQVYMNSTNNAQLIQGYAVQTPVTVNASSAIVIKTTGTVATATTDLTQNSFDLHFEPHSL